MATKMVSTGDYCVECTTIHGLRKTMTEQRMADYNLVVFLCVAFFVKTLLFVNSRSHVLSSVQYDYFRCGGVLNWRRHVEQLSWSFDGARQVDESRAVDVDRCSFWLKSIKPRPACSWSRVFAFALSTIGHTKN